MRSWILILVIAILSSGAILALEKWRGHRAVVGPVRNDYNRSATHIARPETIVYESDPDAAKTLIESGKGYRPLGRTGAAFLVPVCWHDFRGAYFCPDGTLFLHERVSPAGLKRLVAVDLQIHPDDSLTIECAAVARAGAWNSEKWDLARRSTHGASVVRPSTQPGVRYFAGQVDPVDSSHFTIREEEANRSSIIDGWLRDDGNVELRRRD